MNFDLELVPDANGVLTFDVVARDAAGLVTRLPSTITVRPVNDPPRFVAHDVTVLEDGSVSGERVATGVVPGPTNESGTVTLTVAVVGGDAVFVATQPPAISSDGRLSGGVLVPDRNGTAQLQVRASDPEGAITVDTIDVVVAPVNDPPVLLGPRVMATPHNTTNAFELILTDVDSDEPVVASSSQPAFATVAVIEGTRLTITPHNATATGRADVELRLIDEQGGDAIETVSIAVLGRQPSCFHYRAQNASVGDGVYSLLQPQDPSRGCFAVDGCPYAAFCDMEDGDTGDDGGGWTLVMKIDGDDDGFDFTDARWEDLIVGAPQSGDSDHLARAATADLIVDNDIKLRSFLAVKVEELRVGFAPRTADSRSFVFVSPHMVLGESPVDSARVLFAGGERVILRPDRSDWLAVDDRFRLQRNCNRAGVNLGKGRNAAGSVNFLRLGVLGNDQGDCFSPDSFVGIGSSVSNTAGNLALFNGLGTTDQRRFGALLVRSTDLTDVGSFDSCNDVAAAGFVDDEAVFLVNGQPTVCAP